MHFTKLAVLVAAYVPAVLSSTLPQGFTLKRQEASSSFALDADNEPLTFTYLTSSPDDTNWIAVWPVGDGPVDGESSTASLTWDYTPGEEGSVQLSIEELEPGTYEAFFLAEDGYEELAKPIEVVWEGLPADLYFPVEATTLHNARQGEEYEARIDGWVLGKGNAVSIAFEKVSGDEWIEVSSVGTISGIPGKGCADISTAEITATAENGSTATIKVTISVRKPSNKLIEDLSVMSYNTWQGGSNVKNYHAKQLRFLLSINVDIIGLQEAASGNHTIRLGEALGWHYWQSNRSVGILSRYPFVETYGELDPVEIPANDNEASPGGGVRINLNGDSDELVEVNFWSVHLNAYPYGPYHFCDDNQTEQFVLDNETFAGRTPQMASTLAALQSQIGESDDVPVLLVGDFNAPSQLDWTDALAEEHCGIGGNFGWPTSTLPIAAGLIDSFRVANPDPVTAKCESWSPIYPRREGETGVDEPQDRIDFVYGLGGLEVVGSECVAAEGRLEPVPRHRDNEWTSDHLAVLTRYRMT
jgi:endonuclease/exonuclease/phosphatase family metal-dependent hydrolase